MRDAEFREWLDRHYVTASGHLLGPGSRSSTMSNCRRVDRFEGDLDEHFRKDGLVRVLTRLTDGSARIQAKGNRTSVLQSLKSAVVLYEQFCREWPQGSLPVARSGRATPAPILPREGRIRVSKTPGTARWPEWEAPDSGDLLVLARVLARHVRFLAPDIVRAVVKDNEVHREAWSAALEARGVEADRYLWPGGACAFPGIRRYVGSAEIARHRKQGGPEPEGGPTNALATDDNNYPKHVWSFALRGRPFQQFGPGGYELAHLLDHKEYKSRLAEELVRGETLARRVPFGLFTSAANSAYVPRSLIRPTDHAGLLRNLLQRRAESLYGSFCSLAPGGVALRPAARPEWEVDAFEWADPVDALEPLDRFLAFRRERMESLLESAAGQSTPIEAAHVSRPKTRVTSTDVPFHIAVSADRGMVEVWSTYRLRFDSKPDTKSLRDAIGRAVGQLGPAKGVLEALYASPSPDFVDAENVLLYNVGTGSFQHLTRAGLRFERLHEPGPPCPVPLDGECLHYHRYRVQAEGASSSAWRSGDVRWSVQGVRLQSPQELSSLAHVWRAVRCSEPDVAEPLEAGAPYAMSITIAVDRTGTARLESLVKPVVDGVISALHVHDGRDLETVRPRLASQLGAGAAEVERLLMQDEARAVLGRRRLVWPRGEGVQWNPGDDTLVSCTVRLAPTPLPSGASIEAQLTPAIRTPASLG